MYKRSRLFLFYSALALSIFQQKAISQPSTPDSSIDKKAIEWAEAAQINDPANFQKVKYAIVTHLTLVRDWHNGHAYTLVPAGINPANGSKLSELDRDIIICSTKPASVHENLMSALRSALDSAQVETILDKYTV